MIRKAIRNRRILPHEQSAMKVIYLAVMKASERWMMPMQYRKPAMNRLAIEYEGRFDGMLTYTKYLTVSQIIGHFLFPDLADFLLYLHPDFLLYLCPDFLLYLHPDFFRYLYF